MRRLVTRYRFSTVVGVVLSTACASGGVTPKAPVSASNVEAASNKPLVWTPHRTSGKWRYEVRSEATVALLADTGATQVPVQTRIRYTIALDTSAGELQLTGTIDSNVVTTQGRIPQAQGDTAPTRFNGVVAASGKLWNLASNTRSRCKDGVDPAVAAVHDLFVVLPASVTLGSTWQDTVVTVTCRGDLPITTSTVHSYRLADTTMWQGRAAFVVNRTTTYAIRSVEDSTAGRRALSVTGSGSGSATLQIEQSTGVVLSAQGEAHTTLTVNTGRSTVPFRQDATQIIQLTSPEPSTP